MEGEEIA